MSVTTQNGGIDVDVTRGVSAEIDARTALNDVRCGERASRQRPCMGSHVVGTLGDGGATLRLQTTNGPVRLRRQ